MERVLIVEDDERLDELWDLPEYLTQSDDDELLASA